MVGLFESIAQAKDYRKVSERYVKFKGLDAIVASTSPKREMDLQRADYAFKAIFRLYGLPDGGAKDSDGSDSNINNYTGLWIAAGVLNTNADGERYYIGSQREGIVNRWIKHGVKENRIVQIDGEDTVDKVRELGKIPEIKNAPVEYRIGVSSYPLHIARFNLALLYAQREGFISKQVQIVGIEMPYDALFYETSPKFRVGDWVTGIAGLVRDVRRLDKHGFKSSVPGQSSAFHKAIKSLNSEGDKKPEN